MARVSKRLIKWGIAVVVGAGAIALCITGVAVFVDYTARSTPSSPRYGDPTLGVFDPPNRKRNLYSNDITDRNVAMVTYRYMAASLTASDFVDLAEFIQAVEMPKSENFGTMSQIFYVGRETSEQVLAREVRRAAMEQDAALYPQQLFRIGMMTLPRIHPSYAAAVYEGDDEKISVDVDKLEEIMRLRHLSVPD